MPSLKEIRKQYPMYSDVPDDQLARGFHQKFYSDLPFQEFSRKIGYLKGADPSEYDPDSPEYNAKYGAQSGSTLENIRAGVGKGMTDVIRGFGQRVPTSLRSSAGQAAAFAAPGIGPLLGMLSKPKDALVSNEQVADARARDTDLMGTSAGKWGAVGGNVAAALPAAFIPGANTYAGASAIGGVLGALQPSVDNKEMLTNAAIGGVLSPAAMLAGRGLIGGVKGTKAALWDPLTKAGQQRIAERTFQSMAGGTDEAARAAQNIQSGLGDVLPGAQPTTAELAQNAGLSNLERLLKNNPEYTTAFADRAAHNRNAITSAVEGIAGDDVGRAAAVTARDAAASPLYKAADAAVVKADDALMGLMKRPSMEQAWKKAATIAAENGDEVSQDVLSGKTLHYLKVAMDDLSDWSPTSSVGKAEAGAIGKTRDALLSWMDKNIPEYGAARAAFREGSKPINQMDIGQALLKKLEPAISDFGAQTRIRPEAFAQAMRNGDATAANATGFSGASITDILNPDQMRTLTQVGTQLARRVNADELGKAVGSNTGQNLIGQNVLRQFLGPLGLPQSAVERGASGPLLQGILGMPANLAQKATKSIGEPNILKKLVEIGLTPEEAIRVLTQQARQGPGLLRFQGAVVPVVSGANAAGQ